MIRRSQKTLIECLRFLELHNQPTTTPTPENTINLFLKSLPQFTQVLPGVISTLTQPTSWQFRLLVLAALASFDQAESHDYSHKVAMTTIGQLIDMHSQNLTAYDVEFLLATLHYLLTTPHNLFDMLKLIQETMVCDSFLGVDQCSVTLEFSSNNLQSSSRPQRSDISSQQESTAHNRNRKVSTSSKKAQSGGWCGDPLSKSEQRTTSAEYFDIGLAENLLLNQSFEKIVALAEPRNLTRLLRLTVLIVDLRVSIETAMQQYLRPICKLISSPEKTLSKEESELLFDIVRTPSSPNILSSSSSVAHNRTLRFPEIVLSFFKKVLRQKEKLPNREQIIAACCKSRLPLHEWQPTLLQFLFAILKKRDATPQTKQCVEEYIHDLMSGEISLKIIKSLIVNLKIRDGTDFAKAQKTFPYLSKLGKIHKETFKILGLVNHKSGIAWENAPFFKNLTTTGFTIIFRVRLRRNCGQDFKILLQIVFKREDTKPLLIEVRQHPIKRSHWQLRARFEQKHSSNKKQDAAQRNSELLSIECPGNSLFFSASFDAKGLLLTANNQNFLLNEITKQKLARLQPRHLIIGCFPKLTPKTTVPTKPIVEANTVNSTAIVASSNSTSIQQLVCCAIVQDTVITSDIYFQLKDKDISPQMLLGEIKATAPDNKILVYLNSEGDWVYSDENKNLVQKLFKREALQPIYSDCCIRTKPSMTRLLLDSRNLDIFLFLIEYYCLRLKDTELSMACQNITDFLLQQFINIEKQGGAVQYVQDMLPKLVYITWNISQANFKEKGTIGVKLCALALAPASPDLKYKALKTILFNMQLWRNYSFQQQLLILHIASEQLFKEARLIGKCLQDNGLQRLVLSAMTWIRFDLMLNNYETIKVRLSKDQMKTIYGKIKDIILTSFDQAYKLKENDHWLSLLSQIAQIAIVCAMQEEPSAGNPREACKNPEFSPQVHFYMMLAVYEMLQFACAKDRRRLTQALTTKQTTTNSAATASNASLLRNLDQVVYELLILTIRSKRSRRQSIDLDQIFVDNQEQKLTITNIYDSLLSMLLILKNSPVEDIHKRLSSLQRDDDISPEFRLMTKMAELGEALQIQADYNIVMSAIVSKLKSQSNYNLRELCIQIRKYLERLILLYKNTKTDLFLQTLRSPEFVKIFEFMTKNRKQEQQVLGELVRFVFRNYIDMQSIDALHESFWKEFDSPDTKIQLPAPSLHMLINLHRIITNRDLSKRTLVSLIQKHGDTIINAEALAPYSPFQTVKLLLTNQPKLDLAEITVLIEFIKIADQKFNQQTQLHKQPSFNIGLSNNRKLVMLNLLIRLVSLSTNKENSGINIQQVPFNKSVSEKATGSNDINDSIEMSESSSFSQDASFTSAFTPDKLHSSLDYLDSPSVSPRKQSEDEQPKLQLIFNFLLNDEMVVRELQAIQIPQPNKNTFDRTVSWLTNYTAESHRDIYQNSKLVEVSFLSCLRQKYSLSPAFQKPKKPDLFATFIKIKGASASSETQEIKKSKSLRAYVPGKNISLSMLLKQKIDYSHSLQVFTRWTKKSFDLLRDFETTYRNECETSETQWKEAKANNNLYWQEFHNKRDNSCYFKIDKTMGADRSRLNIKLTVNDNLMRPPRGKFRLQVAYRGSEDKDSSMHGSDSEAGDFHNPLHSSSLKQEPATRGRTKTTRKQSVDLQQHKKEQIIPYNCEYVKPKGTYFGKIWITKTSIMFESMTEEERAIVCEDDQVMDISTADHYRVKDKHKFLEIRLASKHQDPRHMPVEVMCKRYILRHTALEITSNNKTYFFNLFHEPTRRKFLKELHNAHKQNSRLEIIVQKGQHFREMQYTKKWQQGKLSNFEYLMVLNHYSSRSFNDLGQYPVFPWVLSNYEAPVCDRNFLNDQTNYRDLQKPMGQLNEKRFKEFQSRHKQLSKQYKNDSKEHFLYGSFYSNPCIVCHYLVRLQPFTTFHCKLQSSKFDQADRLFFSIADQYMNSTNNTADLKELIPEFYSFCEFLRNRNQFSLGMKQDKSIVNNVTLPKWANTPEECVFRFRQALESKYVSKKLHHWIDLIFGCKNTRDKGLNNGNLFHYRTYQHDLFAEEGDEEDCKMNQLYVSEFGQVPESLFAQDEPHPERHHFGAVDTRLDECMAYSFAEPISRQDSLQKIVPLGKDKVLVVCLNKLHLVGVQEKPRVVEVNTLNKVYSSFGDCGEWTWLEFSKLGAIQHSSSRGLFHKIKSQPLKSTSVRAGCCANSTQIILAQENRVCTYRIRTESNNNNNGSQNQDPLVLMNTFYGHQDIVYLIEYCPSHDIIYSFDKSNVLTLRYLTTFKTIRSVHINLGYKTMVRSLLIHKMGFIFFWTDRGTLAVYTLNTLGTQPFLPQTRLVMSDKKQRITCVRLNGEDSSQLLIATNCGNIFAVDMFAIHRHRNQKPFRAFVINSTNSTPIAKCESGKLHLLEKSKNLSESSPLPMDIPPGNLCIKDMEVYFDKPFRRVLVGFESGQVLELRSKNEAKRKINIGFENLF